MISVWLTTFLLNAVWQVSAITLLAFACAKLLQRLPSRYMHTVWVVALMACLLIPVTTVIIQHRANSDGSTRTPSLVAQDSKISSPGTSIRFHSVNRPVLLPRLVTTSLLWAFTLSFVYRSLQLGWGIHRTRRIRRSAHEQELPAVISDIAEQCMRRFSLTRIPLLFSDAVSTPSTVGHRRPIVFLPASFFSTDLSQNEFASALAHEFAHIQRQDFLLNLLYEIVSVPLCFHPFIAFVKSRIAHTRELACDELAAPMLPSASCYATSLLSIAESVSARVPTRPSYALGLLDTTALEERIVNILRRKDSSSRRARALRVTAACLVGAVALGISVFSLKLAAESGSDLQKFVGTWECKYKGQTFFTLRMAVNDGVLGGTAVHVTRVAWVDGELIPGTDETTQDRIFDTHASGQELLLKIADGPNVADPISLSFKLIGKDEAQVMPLMEKRGDVPPPKKPWHFVRGR